MPPGRARVSAPAGLGKGMINWSGNVRLGKVLLSCNNKYCHNELTFSQGPLKFSCAGKSRSLVHTLPIWEYNLRFG